MVPKHGKPHGGNTQGVSDRKGIGLSIECKGRNDGEAKAVSTATSRSVSSVSWKIPPPRRSPIHGPMFGRTMVAFEVLRSMEVLLCIKDTGGREIGNRRIALVPTIRDAATERNRNQGTTLKRDFILIQALMVAEVPIVLLIRDD